jgi:hypothetical protein
MCQRKKYAEGPTLHDNNPNRGTATLMNRKSYQSVGDIRTRSCSVHDLDRFYRMLLNHKFQIFLVARLFPRDLRPSCSV